MKRSLPPSEEDLEHGADEEWAQAHHEREFVRDCKFRREAEPEE